MQLKLLLTWNFVINQVINTLMLNVSCCLYITLYASLNKPKTPPRVTWLSCVRGLRSDWLRQHLQYSQMSAEFRTLRTFKHTHYSVFTDLWDVSSLRDRRRLHHIICRLLVIRTASLCGNRFGELLIYSFSYNQHLCWVSLTFRWMTWTCCILEQKKN